MAAANNPALEAFIAHSGGEFLLAQVLIRRRGDGYELRHGADREVPAESLRQIALADVRQLAQFTASGAFRPLKSAPNLQTGWRLSVKDDAGLEAALQQLYPGAVADRFAVQTGAPPVTHYREFTARQTGMYRITTMLTDEQAARMTRACCDASFCLKQRLWTIGDLEPDTSESKSAIPCLEPCAVLLEFARTTLRLIQEKTEPVELAPSELASAIAALDCALAHPNPGIREADFSAPDNPRRLKWLREGLAARLNRDQPAAES